MTKLISLDAALDAVTYMPDRWRNVAVEALRALPAQEMATDRHADLYYALNDFVQELSHGACPSNLKPELAQAIKALKKFRGQIPGQPEPEKGETP